MTCTVCNTILFDGNTNKSPFGGLRPKCRKCEDKWDADRKRTYGN